MEVCASRDILVPGSMRNFIGKRNHVMRKTGSYLVYLHNSEHFILYKRCVTHILRLNDLVLIEVGCETVSVSVFQT